MKIRHIRFSVFTSLLIFIITLPVLSQSASYRATVSRYSGSQIGQTIQAGTPIDLANRIYAVIRPSNSPLPKINISLGTVNLSTFRNTVQSKGISANYYEYIKVQSVSKPSWDLIELSLSSVRPSSKIYAVSLRKNGYLMTATIPFRVTGTRKGDPILKFDRLKEILEDGTFFWYALDIGNSGVQSDWLIKNIRSRDSRLNLLERSHFQCERSSEGSATKPVQGGNICFSPPKYLIRLSRS